ncbi:hypothetical protein A6V39_01375 [Candidatus Mycoplasma haematobovis]|uniref:Uncharacterized protein n=1 Tax=Candidatus Mycoplasma haematobovis TaxID=432608 RepID=A0A1A9QFF8_9MOLU|nr:hypothetical protein [Candidatus Mycoplasma haematobovis]OAL10705.1 hypothetical protein A6V39_01375 [Candidatus Mycoplasma haematobovis]
MILRGHNLILASFAGGTLCFSASNIGVWMSKTRPSPYQLGFKKIMDDNVNQKELFELIVKENRDKITKKFGSSHAGYEQLKQWCISNQAKPWVKDFKDVLELCYIPKKVAYRLITEGYRVKNNYPVDSTDSNQDCTKEKMFDYVSDGATTTNYFIVKGNCMELKKQN